jgi:hypothetical protein
MGTRPVQPGVNSTVLDLNQPTSSAAGMYICLHSRNGHVNGNGPAQIQSSDDNSTWTNVTNATLSWDSTMSDKRIAIEIERPMHRYYRVVTARATANSVITRIEAFVAGLRSCQRFNC